jgi:hypothetical protein
VNEKEEHNMTRMTRKLARQARKMSNEELRAALWEVRDRTESIENPSEQLFLREDIYSKELKKRELLEWALRTKSQI